MMKWWGYVLCIILILVGTFFGIKLFQQVTKTSYVNGDINIENQFQQESFSYGSSSVVFYPTENKASYEFNVGLKKVPTFNGAENKYEVILNDYVLYDAEITAGKVECDVKMNFYDTDGSLACAGEMKLKIEFFTHGTELTLSCPDETTAKYFEQYFTDNGIRLFVNEILK